MQKIYKNNLRSKITYMDDEKNRKEAEQIYRGRADANFVLTKKPPPPNNRLGYIFSGWLLCTDCTECPVRTSS